VNFGRNNAGARDGYAYAVSTDQWDNGSPGVRLPGLSPTGEPKATVLFLPYHGHGTPKQHFPGQTLEF
jgi:hypothetical protein